MLFFWQDNHCKEAFESEIFRQQYTEEYRNGNSKRNGQGRTGSFREPLGGGLVDSWSDSNGNFYRKYADGWIEQGGNAAKSGANTMISLNVAFSSANYSAFAIPCTSSETARSGLVGIYGKKVSAFWARSINADGTPSGSDLMTWVAFGY